MVKIIHSLANGANTVGPITYRDDFQNVVQPHLENLQPKNRVIVSTLTEVRRDLADKYDADRIVQILHSMKYLHELESLDQFASSGLPVHFITHYMNVAFAINNHTKYTVSFIPMSINLARLPDDDPNIRIRDDRIIYFGNLYDEKMDLYHHIKKHEPGMDTLSFNRWNSQNWLDNKQCLQIVQQYRYGIGVGRCALEMWAMGMDVMLAGENYGGVIHNNHGFRFHQYYNFNTQAESQRPMPKDFAKEIQWLRQVRWKPDLRKIDMRTYIPNYIEAVL